MGDSPTLTKKNGEMFEVRGRREEKKRGRGRKKRKWKGRRRGERKRKE